MVEVTGSIPVRPTSFCGKTGRRNRRGKQVQVRKKFLAPMLGVAFCVAVLLLATSVLLAEGATADETAGEEFVATPQIGEFDLSEGTVPLRDVKAFRKRVFSGLNESMKKLSRVAREDSPDPAVIREELQTIVIYAREAVQAFHPDTVYLPKRRALPAIWQRPDEFVSAAAALERAALAELASDPAELSASLERIAATCSACHRPFRARR